MDKWCNWNIMHLLAHWQLLLNAPLSANRAHCWLILSLILLKIWINDIHRIPSVHTLHRQVCRTPAGQCCSTWLDRRHTAFFPTSMNILTLPFITAPTPFLRKLHPGLCTSTDVLSDRYRGRVGCLLGQQLSSHLNSFRTCSGNLTSTTDSPASSPAFCNHPRHMQFICSAYCKEHTEWKSPLLQQSCGVFFSTALLAQRLHFPSPSNSMSFLRFSALDLKNSPQSSAKCFLNSLYLALNILFTLILP